MPGTWGVNTTGPTRQARQTMTSDEEPVRQRRSRANYHPQVW
ncbi:hypothetical protein I552_5729 [Mycobacterium xenopi 3993]|nr:hypothetical protein I552_5729 [Mycobacterium xenopi 3993]